MDKENQMYKDGFVCVFDGVMLLGIIYTPVPYNAIVAALAILVTWYHGYVHGREELPDFLKKLDRG